MRNRLEINLLLPLQPSPLMRDWNFLSPSHTLLYQLVQSPGAAGVAGQGGEAEGAARSRVRRQTCKVPFSLQLPDHNRDSCHKDNGCVPGKR